MQGAKKHVEHPLPAPPPEQCMHGQCAFAVWRTTDRAVCGAKDMFVALHTAQLGLSGCAHSLIVIKHEILTRQSQIVD